MPQYPAKNSLVGPANVTDGATTVNSAQVIMFTGATVTQTASNRATVTVPGGGAGLSGMTAAQVPIAATATTVTSSKPLSGSTTSGAVIVSASTAAKTSGAAATWDANGGLVAAASKPLLAIHNAVVVGGAAGNITVTGIATTNTLVAVTYFVGAGTTVTDVSNLTSQFTITATDTINNTGGTATTGGKLQVLWV